MELENIKRNTTWNDASESINSNFSKIRQELLLLGNKEGLTEAELEEFLTSNGYTKEEWVLAQNLLLEERIENLEQGGGGGSANIDVDTAMSDTSENAVQNKVIKKYVDEAYGQANKYTDEEIEHIEGVLNARIDSLEGGNVYNVYYTENNELSEEQLEANGKAYAALMSEEKAAFYLVQEGNVYSRLIVSTTMKSASTEAIAVEAHVILPTGNKTMLGTTAINLYSDGHISMTVVQNNLPSEDEVNAALEQKQDKLVSGTTIKTINGESILGEGDIVIEGGGGSSEGSQKTYVFYLDEELTEEKIEANKRAYEAAMAETPALYVISSYGDIIVPTMIYISSSDGDSYVRFGISSNEEIVNSEARNREYLDVFNTQIRFAEDGTFTIHKQFESRLAKVSMLDEVIAKVDEIPDLIANLPQGETFNYVHIPFEDAPLDEEQLAENAASCTKWLEAYKNNEPLPILCWSAFPYGDGRMHVYGPSDGLLNFSISTTLGFGNDESLDNAELVAMLIVAGTLASSGEVELYMPLEEKILTTINSFKTINGQSIFGEGDIEIQGGGNVEVDAELSDTSENAVSNKAVTMALAETEEVTAAALNELNKRFEDYATKEELEDALADVSIEVDSAMSDTSENAVGNKVIKKYVDDADKSVKEYVDDADNALAERISTLEQNSGGGGSSNAEVDSELSESSTNAVANKAVTEAIVEDEEVISVALNQMNTRFDNYASLDALATEIQNAKDVIDASIVDNEEVAAAALVDLDKRLKDILTILGNAGLI